MMVFRMQEKSLKVTNKSVFFFFFDNAFNGLNAFTCILGATIAKNIDFYLFSKADILLNETFSSEKYRIFKITRSYLLYRGKSCSINIGNKYTLISGLYSAKKNNHQDFQDCLMYLHMDKMYVALLRVCVHRHLGTPKCNAH